MTIVALAATAALAAACSSEQQRTTPTPEPSASPSVSESPSVSASPTPGPSARPGQDGGPPEVAGAVARNLRVPWGLAFLDDGSALATERDSWRLLHLTPRGEGWRTRDLGVLATGPGSGPSVEGGLLGIAVEPDGGEDPRVFVYVTTAEDNRVVSATWEGGGFSEWEPVLTGIPRYDYHDGGRIAFGPDGHLYVATGDAGQPELAQDQESLAGKILRMRPDGTPAPGNPDGDSLVYSSGHRNVQGLAWDDDGQLWASEFGENSYDELNRIEAGGNYGWPEVEGRAADNPGADADDYVDPVAVWSTDEASPSGLAWADGRLWLGALRGTRLWEVRIADDGKATSTPHFVGEYGRMRTVVATPEGELWVTTSNHDGRGEPAQVDDRILRLTW
ncbi:PQQ-dependent sugar dehydrogenase [Nocardioides malaquae]|uniref:PQQ-dependent sugar dehydrogenase n=1 Tax=Nocardioides malaquae TaxID=2773426 RepID=UPI0029D41762|nr:PQQ-dependent sugar dehydrogenase [Nocardioides malaquae]